MGLFKGFRNEKMSKIKVLFICHANKWIEEVRNVVIGDVGL